MNTRRLSILISCALTGGISSALGQSQKPGPSSEYNAAYLFAAGPLNSVSELVVFPVDRAAFSIALPLPTTFLDFASAGRVLYAVVKDTGRDPGHLAPQLCRIEFNPARATLLQASAGLSHIMSFAVDEHGKKVVACGGRPHPVDLGGGLFEIDLVGGTIRKVIANPACMGPYLTSADSESAWSDLSLSPDGHRAAAIRLRSLEVLDLVNGTARVIASGYRRAAWSPDGKWIAAMENGGRYRTVLFDADTLTKRRNLGVTQLHWSPDSRYLLGGRESMNCDTMQAVDVENGKRITIEGSKCKVYGTPVGWVNNDVKPEGDRAIPKLNKN